MCEAKDGVSFYRPRQPQETPFYKLACPPKPWRRRVAEEVCAEVAQRQFVFTIPKRLTGSDAQFDPRHGAPVGDPGGSGQPARHRAPPGTLGGPENHDGESRTLMAKHLGNSLLDDKHARLKADFVVANPPFNQQGWGADKIAKDDKASRLAAGRSRSRTAMRITSGLPISSTI